MRSSIMALPTRRIAGPILSLVIVALALVLEGATPRSALADASATPVPVSAAGVDGPNGTLIEKTEFEHVVQQEITTVTNRVWGLVTLDGDPIADQPAAGEPLDAFTGRVGASSCIEAFVDTAVESRNQGSTFAETSSVDVTQSEDADVLGDIAADGGGDFLVVEGTVTITTTITTIETQHITEITTETYDLACVSAATFPEPDPPAPSPPSDTTAPPAAPPVQPLAATGGQSLPRSERGGGGSTSTAVSLPNSGVGTAMTTATAALPGGAFLLGLGAASALAAAGLTLRRPERRYARRWWAPSD